MVMVVVVSDGSVRRWYTGLKRGSGEVTVGSLEVALRDCSGLWSADSSIVWEWSLCNAGLRHS